MNLKGLTSSLASLLVLLLFGCATAPSAVPRYSSSVYSPQTSRALEQFISDNLNEIVYLDIAFVSSYARFYKENKTDFVVLSIAKSSCTASSAKGTVGASCASYQFSLDGRYLKLNYNNKTYRLSGYFFVAKKMHHYQGGIYFLRPMPPPIELFE